MVLRGGRRTDRFEDRLTVVDKGPAATAPRSPVLPGLPGARALVTGGSRGIGRAAAEWLAGAGAHVGIGYRENGEAAREALRRITERIEPRAADRLPWAEAADLVSVEGVDRLFNRVDLEFGGRLDVFVGNAGVWNPQPRPLADLEPADWSEMMDANLTSTFLCTRAAAARMTSGGRIVLVSSTAAQRGEAGHAHYAASKGAVQSLVKSLAAELGPKGIRVNAVAPGWVDTDMTAGVLRGPEREAIIASIPARRIAAAEDIAGPILFLASDLSRHVIGEILNVNGGSVLCG